MLRRNTEAPSSSKMPVLTKAKGHNITEDGVLQICFTLDILFSQLLLISVSFSYGITASHLIKAFY
jgi:hypothetical protein